MIKLHFNSLLLLFPALYMNKLYFNYSSLVLLFDEKIENNDK